MKNALVFVLGFSFALLFSFTYRSVYVARFNYFFEKTMKDKSGKYSDLSSRFEYVYANIGLTEKRLAQLLEEDSVRCFGPEKRRPAHCDLVRKLYKTISKEEP